MYPCRLEVREYRKSMSFSEAGVKSLYEQFATGLCQNASSRAVQLGTSWEVSFFSDTFCLADVCHVASWTTCFCIVIKPTKKINNFPQSRKTSRVTANFWAFGSEQCRRKAKSWKEMTKLVPRTPVFAYFWSVCECGSKVYSFFFLVFF